MSARKKPATVHAWPVEHMERQTFGVQTYYGSWVLMELAASSFKEAAEKANEIILNQYVDWGDNWEVTV